MELYGVEESDRLYYKTLFISLTLYLLTSGTFIGLKNDLNPLLERPPISKRLTRLIINLPVPPEPKKKIVAVKEPLHPKKVEKKVKKVKKKVAPKKPKLRPPVKKKSVRDLEKTGMLKFMDGLDDEADDLDFLDNVEIVAISDDLGVNEGESAVFTSDDALSSDEIEFEMDEDLLSDLSEKYDFSSNVTVDMPVQESLPDSDKPLIDYNRDDLEVRDTSFIGKTVSKYSNGLKYCYDKSLKQYSRLSGGLIVRFTILSTGSTEEVSIVSGDMSNDEGLQKCLTGLIGRWSFPESKIERLVVTYPIRFINRS